MFQAYFISILIVLVHVVMAAVSLNSTLSEEKPAFCRTPSPPEHGTYELHGVASHPGSSYYVSFQIITRCDQGYKIKGKFIVYCSNGVFSDPMPTCVEEAARVPSNFGIGSSIVIQPSACEAPDYPKHGTYRLDGIPHQERSNAYEQFNLTIRCNQRYELRGERVVSCENGQWSSELPTCELPAMIIERRIETPFSNSVSSTKCITPQLTKGIHFVVNGKDQDKPGEEYDSIALMAYCDSEFILKGNEQTLCVNGHWSNSIPYCLDKCHLKEDVTVDFYCRNLTELVLCKEYLIPGTEVFPKCKNRYKYEGNIQKMVCGEDGYFDHVVRCVSEGDVTECGLSSVNHPLLSGGMTAEPGEIPWHAGIYTKNTRPYMLLCGGSVITSIYVISAAHCFWYGDKKVDSYEYSVAVGKVYRYWSESHDIHAQHFNVANVHTPSLFFGSLGNYQSDIALVKLATAIQFNRFVMPICLDFAEDLNTQLQDGDLGKIAGWGFTTIDGDPATMLKTTFLPYISLDKCINGSTPNFKPYLNSDKICAGFSNGTAVCKGDSGGGFVFEKRKDGATRYYLQGIVSSAPAGDNMRCNIYSWAIFTDVYFHRHFIKKYL